METTRINDIKIRMDNLSDEELAAMEWHARERLARAERDLRRIIEQRQKVMGARAMDATLVTPETTPEVLEDVM